MPKNFLNEPTRQDGGAVLVILVNLVVRTVRALWPFLLIAFLGRGGNEQDSESNYFLWLGIAGGVYSAIISIISYFRFYYFVENDEFVIRKGVLRRARLNVPFDRIQTINFQQTPVHRLLNVVGVQIDTAGSRGNEFVIDAVKQERAEEIRDYLMLRKREAVAEQLENPDEATSGPAPVGEIEQQLLLRLLPADLARVGVSQNHVRTAFLIIGFFFGIWFNVREALGNDLEEQLVDRVIRGDVSTSWWDYLPAIGLLLFVSFIVTLVMTVVRYYGLKLWQTDRGFKMVSGLFNRQEVSVSLQKVQVIEWLRNPIRKALGLYTVRLKQAASAAVNKRTSINVPGCYEAQLDRIRFTYFPEENDHAWTSFKPHRAVIFRRTRNFGLPVAVVLVALNYFGYENGAASFLWLFVLPLFWFWNVLLYRKWTYETSTEGLRILRGAIGEKATLLRWHKVQSVAIRQSPFQRRKALANLTLYTAAGSTNVIWIDLKQARRIANWVLYRVERSEEAWM